MSSAVFENVNNMNYEQMMMQKKSSKKRLFASAAHKIKKFLGKLKKTASKAEPEERVIVCRTAEELQNAVNEALENGTAFQRVVFVNPADLDICLRGGEVSYSLCQIAERQTR